LITLALPWGAITRAAPPAEPTSGQRQLQIPPAMGHSGGMMPGDAIFDGMTPTDCAELDIPVGRSSAFNVLQGFAQPARKLAFLYEFDVWSVREDGSDSRQLTDSGAVLGFAWSPNGDEIAFFGPAGAYEIDIYVMNEDGTNVRRVTYGSGARIGLLDWHGSKIAFVRFRSGFPAILWLAYVDLNDPNSTIVNVSPELEDWSPVHHITRLPWLRWSPDGRWIALSVGTARGIASADGTRFFRIDDMLHPEWRSDSSQVIYATSQDGLGFFDLNAESEGWLSDVRANLVDYSPDDLFVAYASDWQLKRMNADNTYHITLVDQPAAHIDWSPSGDRIVYGSWGSGDPYPEYTGVHIVNADGSGHITLARGFAQSPMWQPQTSTYSISGQVTDDSGDPIPGVSVSVEGGGSAVTNANGQYIITSHQTGVYTLTPTTAGFFWSPASRTVIVPPDATGQDFTGRNIQKEVNLSAPNAVKFGDVLEYTVHLVYPETGVLLFRDPLPPHTTYIESSLDAPAGVTYDPSVNAISGTLNLVSGIPIELSFAVQVEITGTVGLAPIIANEACAYMTNGELVDCDEVINFTYVWSLFLPVVME
jgi:Tol biopolymer transport system component